jgi:hypothetical protein
MNQRFFGVSNEPNDVKYLKGFLDKHAQELKTLDSGRFLLFNKGKISMVECQPYESHAAKTEIQIPEPERTEPIKTNQNISIVPFAKLFILIGFAVLVLSSLKRI